MSDIDLIKSKAFMGVSIRHPFYADRENILHAIELAKNFDSFLTLVVDYPYRLSLQALEKISADNAVKVALAEGEQLKEFLIGVSNSFTTVKVFTWQKLKINSYIIWLERTKSLLKQDQDFYKLLQGEFTDTVATKIGDDRHARDLSIEFLAEEVAMFAALADDGYSTRISKYSRSKSLDYLLQRYGKSIDHIQLPVEVTV